MYSQTRSTKTPCTTTSVGREFLLFRVCSLLLKTHNTLATNTFATGRMRRSRERSQHRRPEYGGERRSQSMSSERSDHEPERATRGKKANRDGGGGNAKTSGSGGGRGRSSEQNVSDSRDGSNKGSGRDRDHHRRENPDRRAGSGVRNGDDRGWSSGHSPAALDRSSDRRAARDSSDRGISYNRENRERGGGGGGGGERGRDRRKTGAHTRHRSSRSPERRSEKPNYGRPREKVRERSSSEQSRDGGGGGDDGGGGAARSASRTRSPPSSDRGASYHHHRPRRSSSLSESDDDNRRGRKERRGGERSRSTSESSRQGDKGKFAGHDSRSRSRSRSSRSRSPPPPSPRREDSSRQRGSSSEQQPRRQRSGERGKAGGGAHRRDRSTSRCVSLHVCRVCFRVSISCGVVRNAVPVLLPCDKAIMVDGLKVELCPTCGVRELRKPQR